MPVADTSLETAAWGWKGSAAEFLGLSEEDWLRSLSRHHGRLLGEPPSGSQIEAWKTERPVVFAALEEARRLLTGVDEWGVVFEYELPMEGGRRPDVVVLAGATVVVVEFKQQRHVSVAALDQAEGYARDLADYHSASRDLEVIAVLALVNDPGRGAARPGVTVARPGELGDVLAGVAAGEQLDLDTWLHGTYAPLPTLVRAARRIFEHKPLPHVRRAISAGVPETVDLISQLASEAEATSQRRLVLVAGVPGAGKTLVGLRVVYEHADDHAPASFLSGNGPLVEVLQDALESRVFVRDLHAYIRNHGINRRDPEHNVVVFDEAQRAWDARYMEFKRGIDKSEPELLLDAGTRMPGWAAMIGLVGDGQEIYSGEEGGLGQWRDAVEASEEPWEVHCPPRLADSFSGLTVVTHDELDLTISLRSRRAEKLHLWVSSLLGGDLDAAALLAEEIRRDAFPMWFSRNLDAVEDYAIERYDGEDDRLYGLVATSHAKNLAELGIDNTFQGTKRVRIARWFNDPPTSDSSGAALERPITEFQCQGLELDLPIVCWGDDVVWKDGEWKLRPINRRYPQDDPDGLLINSYRVLLTRGRDGLLVFVPPQASLDETAAALERAGLELLPDQSRAA